MSPRLLASWQRSEEYGVPLESIDPVYSGPQDEKALFFECGQAVLTDLHRTLVNEPIFLDAHRPRKTGAQQAQR